MIKLLDNPKTDTYNELKTLVLSQEFPWYYMDSGDGLSYFGHITINRPENLYSTAVSPHTLLFGEVMIDLIHSNGLVKNAKGFHLVRGSVNLVLPSNGRQFSDKHIDHLFPHINLIAYLTSSGGRTICGEEEHNPKEDDVIVMDGEHYMELPKKERRIILLATLMVY